MDGGYIVRDAGTYAITSRDLDLLIGLENPDCARVYLFLLKNGPTPEEMAVQKLGLSATRVSAALKALCGADLIGAGSAPARSSPVPNYELPAEYSSAEISNALEKDQGFKWLIEEAQRRLGKVFTASDIGSMLRIYQWLGLPVEVISLLITYCVDDMKRRNGEGRMPTVRQIEKEALIWDEEGIHTAEKADEYVRRRFIAREKQGELLGRLGVSDLTPSVEKYISQWIDWGFEPDVVYHAYDITVLKTGSLKWAYLNSILKNWRENNLMTLDQIEKKDYKPRSGHSKEGGIVPGQRERDIVRRNQSYGKAGKE